MIESSSQPGASSDQMAVLVFPTDMSSVSGGDLDVEFVPEETERLMAGEEEWREEEPTSSTHRWTNTDPHLDSFMLFSFAGTWQPSCPCLQMMTWRRWWRRP